MSSSLSHHSNNPFRDAVIPNSTGQSLSSSRTYAPPPGPPPGASNTSHLPTVPSVSISNESDARLPPGENFQSELDGMPSEPPPPYTPTPSRWEEETVQYGPRRPFQPAPPPLRPIPPQSTRPAASPNPGQSLQSGAYMAPSGPPHINTTSSPSSFRPPPGPPPRHPSTLLSPDGSTPPRRSASSASSHSHTPSMPGSFAPPPGPPPLARRRSDVGSQGNGSGVSASSSTPPPVPNDGKPTRKPVVGHPYMHNGEVLVYPPRFTCNKCLNIGYKEFDVNHPCRKCWERYGKPFEGPLAYADWSDRTNNFQRPLPPGIRIPTSAPPRPRPSSSQYPGASAQSQYRGAPPTNQGPLSPPVVTSGPPPPGALVVMPGDPRIGGRLCYHCGGSGVLPSLFFFDEETCNVCRGSGRVF